MSVDYDGRVFRPVEADDDASADGADRAGHGGERGTDAPGVLGRYTQRGDLVDAQITGGAVRVGHLVATVDAGGVLDAAYCLVLASGEVVAGRCASTPTTLPDGRLRLTERWRRDDGSTGTSVIEEVPT